MKKLTISPLVLGALIVALAIAISVLLTSLQPKENSPVGFVLPPGDAVKGEQTFARLGCLNCHVVDGVAFPIAPDRVEADLVVPLGGKITRAKPYGELVTSVIHPSETIRYGADAKYVDAAGNSLMPDFSATMTVREMTDLVAFLREHYEVYAPEYPRGEYIY